MQIAAFRVDDGLYGVPVLIVEEFFRPMPVTPVPLTNPKIEGLVHHRGKTATVLNLRKCLGKPARDQRQKTKMILLETASDLIADAVKIGVSSSDEPVVLRVDKTEAILNVDVRQISPRPAHIPYNFVEGIIRAKNAEYMMILNIQRLVEAIMNEKEF